MKYSKDPTPGDYDHRSQDTCKKHGPNVPHYRKKGSLGQYSCVECSADEILELDVPFWEAT